MGEEKKNPQKLKRIEAAAYDYDNDPRWADYWSNILIPSHMASRSGVVDHFERKFYQCYIDSNDFSNSWLQFTGPAPLRRFNLSFHQPSTASTQ
ncbi:hypothetical protein V6N13_093252 [Hibiscus sabdariffa]